MIEVHCSTISLDCNSQRLLQSLVNQRVFVLIEIGKESHVDSSACHIVFFSSDAHTHLRTLRTPYSSYPGLVKMVVPHTLRTPFCKSYRTKSTVLEKRPRMSDPGSDVFGKSMHLFSANERQAMNQHSKI